MREVKKIIRENKIDIVHVHKTLTMVSPSVFLCGFPCHAPVVQTLHNFRTSCPAGSFFRDNVICEGMRCRRSALCRASQMLSRQYGADRGERDDFKDPPDAWYVPRVNFICLTEFNRKKLLNALNAPSVPKRRWAVDADRVYIKPNFTFAEGLAPSNESGQEEYFLFAGRVEALKGIDIAIKAFEQLPEKSLYCGNRSDDGGDAGVCEGASAYKYQIFGIFAERGNVERFYHARAVIMTSQCYEAFAMTIAEAYSYGVPVIAGKCRQYGRHGEGRDHGCEV